VSGRLLSALLLAALLLAIAWRALAGQHELRASRLVRAVETTSPAALAAGPAGKGLLRQNLALALEATVLDPPSLPAAQALGSVYLLLDRPDDAARAYERALVLQPAAEIYMDLGHAYRAAGERANSDEALADRAKARANYATAVALDSRLAAQVPAGAL